MFLPVSKYSTNLTLSCSLYQVGGLTCILKYLNPRARTVLYVHSLKHPHWFPQLSEKLLSTHFSDNGSQPRCDWSVVFALIILFVIGTCSYNRLSLAVTSEVFTKMYPCNTNLKKALTSYNKNSSQEISANVRLQTQKSILGLPTIKESCSMRNPCHFVIFCIIFHSYKVLK